MRFNYILVFLFSISFGFCKEADSVPIIEKIAFEKDTLHSLKGTMYLPANRKPGKIIICLTSIWEEDSHPDFTATRDTLLLMRKYIQHFTDNHIGVLLLTRGVKWNEHSNRPLTSIKTLVSDTEKVFIYLKSDEKYQKIPIGIMGSSEAGCAAAIVVSQHKDIAFSILLSTPGVTGYDEFDYDVEKRNQPFLIPGGFLTTLNDSVYIFNKKRYVYNAEKQVSVEVFYDNFYKGISAIRRQIIPQYSNYDTIRTQAVKLFIKKWQGTKFKLYYNDRKEGKIPAEKFINDLISLGMFTPRNIELLKWDPKLYFPEIKQPVLMLYGEKDINISLKPGVDSVRRIIKDYKLTNFSLKYYDGLDHSLRPYREKKEKRPAGETTPDFVFNDIVNWLVEINIK
ncbi:hypothetical protein EOD40_08195 [Flavobacterium sufflavum]|uniref:Alpha/beta hydrolase n=1 Tax=Flavobacterium sufflavum TaxID=1921138 RepID=A0A437KVR1_9FLAO|nr:hypothetical protein [Flavobacterium sufflavum]RVT76478.1 hypothetical protein EOD40_08195 [Flavobacterium sufflavum]